MLLQIVFFWMLLSAALLAQKVTAIKFVGLAHLSPTVAKEIADIRVGEEMDAGKINESIKNFFSQGYFKDVWVDKQGGVLIYHFDEKTAIANIDIQGYGSGDEGKELLASIGLKKGDLYDKRTVKRAKRTLIARLESQGNYDSVVDVKVEDVGESSVSVVFTVNKGEKIIIKKINFIGASEIDQDELQIDLANKEEDTLGWMPWRNNGEAAVDQLEYDAFRVKNKYMENGYLDAEVSKPLMRVDPGSYKAEVDYQITEGVQYHVGTIGVTQEIKGLKAENLKDLLTLKEGKVFNVKRMRTDIKVLEEEVGNLGFAYARVMPQMKKDPETKIVNLQYVIQPGQPVTINDVIISGNDTTKDRVIRRYIYLAPGDAYSARDLQDSKSALGRTGFFESVDIQTQRLSEEKVNLLVNVKETSTGTISAGGGYGSYEGLMVNASISDRNIFGSGINTTLGFEISQISKNGNLSFINPKIWDSMYSFGLSFYKRDYEYVDYTQDQVGASVTLGREFLRYFNGSIGFSYSDNQSTLNDNSVSTIENFLYDDQYEKTAFNVGVRFDNTDDFYMPRRGMKFDVNFEYAELNGNDFNATVFPGGYGTVLRTDAKLGLYYGMEDLIDYDLILRAKVQFSYIDREEGEKLPTAEKLFMGGIGSVRGYEPYSLSPHLPNGDLVGGTERTIGSIEASIPLSAAAKMRLAAFYDYGVIGSDRVFLNGAIATLGDVSRSSTGVVLEWQSPFGPINIVLAYPIDDEADDRTASFEFSMGTRF